MGVEDSTPQEMPVFGAVEDLLLGILRPYFEGKSVTVAAEYYEGIPTPAVIPLHVEGSSDSGLYDGNQLFTQPAQVEINTLCEGVEASVISAELQEACRHALIQAWQKQTVIPGVGCINKIEATSTATRQQGIGQYNLPTGTVRYEATYRVLLRPDSKAASNRFITRER